MVNFSYIFPIKKCFIGDAVCDGGSLTWEHKTKSDVLSNLDVSNITTSQLEELELERMKFNAFKVADEVAERIDCGVAPDGYMKSFASKDADKLFYWDKCYLLGFIERKNNQVVPGYNYYSKLEAFSKKHVTIGEKYFEFVKFGCTSSGTPCGHCQEMGWVDVACFAIPEPMPDYTSDEFKYQHVKDTPSDIDGVSREVNDFNPRVQLKKLFHEGQLNNGDAEIIDNFCQKYIVDQYIVRNALNDLHCKEATRETRKKEKQNRRDAEQKQSYDDINWLEIVKNRTINKLLVSTLDKYLIRHNMMGCFKLKKKEKIEAIVNHVNLQVFQNRDFITENADSGEESSDIYDSDDEMDEVCTLRSTIYLQILSY